MRVTTACAPILALLCTAPLGAADFVVTRFDDPSPGACSPGDCSFREAVIAANADAQTDRILLAAGRYELTRAGSDNTAAAGDVDLLQDVEIVGQGASLTTIDASAIEGALESFSPSDVVLRGVTIETGVADGGQSAGVTCAGDTSLIEECEIVGGASATNGSAVLVRSGCELTLRRSTIAEAEHVGLSIITDSSAFVDNSTIFGSAGAEIFVLAGFLRLSHSTVVASSDAPTDVEAQTGAAVEIRSSIVVGSCGSQGGSVITSLGGNMESPGDTCGFAAAFDQTDVPVPFLGLLADNGGPTRTMAPLSGAAPSVDARGDGNCALFDQRGAPRPFDGDAAGGPQCDAGAFELGSTPTTGLVFADGLEDGDTAAWSAVVP